jgi:hypothetical protein
MTTTIKSHRNEFYYICLDVEHCYSYSYYKVEVYPSINDALCGYPIKSIVYSLDERKNALATFNRYKRTYQ